MTPNSLIEFQFTIKAQKHKEELHRDSPIAVPEPLRPDSPFMTLCDAV
jgi:hypothetical protein